MDHSMVQMDGLAVRGLGAADLTGNNFSAQQELTLQILSLTSSCLSIIAGCFSLYWFSRIQLHFRHHLITLLICSDLFKAIWYFVSAALALKIDPARFDHGFCQASGFFLSFGIEASDYAILVIAVHSALCIFRPNTHLGETGLYSIRYIVYALWIALPGVAAGLGFLNGGVYISTGAFCYLPLRPFWYRLGLSWVPRYVIFLTILTLYAMIYYFVSAKFKNLSRTSGDSYKRPSEWVHTSASRSRKAVLHFFHPTSLRNEKTHTMSPGQSMGSQAKDTAVDAIDMEMKPTEIESSGAPAWENYSFGSSIIPLAIPRHSDIHPTQGVESLYKASVSTQRTSVADQTPRDNRRSLIEFLQEDPPADLVPATPGLNSAVVTEEIASETRARQTAIKRQLRFMFIYPLVYLISWIPSSVQHFTLYSDAVAAHPSFALACVATCFVALQCFFDSVVFSYRETPWRYSGGAANKPRTRQNSVDDGSGPGTWRSLFARQDTAVGEKETTDKSKDEIVKPELQSQDSSHTHTPRSSIIHRISNSFHHSGETTPNKRLSGGSGGLFAKRAGKSKAEMIAEARAARHRRELETETAIKGQEERQRQRKQSILRRGGADRSWWEVEGRKRKDSVLLGLDQDLSRTRSGGTTDSNIASPSSLASNLFSPRRFRGSFSQTPAEQSPRTVPPLSPGELSPGSQTLTANTDSRRLRSASMLSPAIREQDQGMTTVKEEDDGLSKTEEEDSISPTRASPSSSEQP